MIIYHFRQLKKVSLINNTDNFRVFSSVADFFNLFNILFKLLYKENSKLFLKNNIKLNDDKNRSFNEFDYFNIHTNDNQEEYNCYIAFLLNKKIYDINVYINNSKEKNKFLINLHEFYSFEELKISYIIYKNFYLKLINRITYESINFYKNEMLNILEKENNILYETNIVNSINNKFFLCLKSLDDLITLELQIFKKFKFVDYYESKENTNKQYINNYLIKNAYNILTEYNVFVWELSNYFKCILHVNFKKFVNIDNKTIKLLDKNEYNKFNIDANNLRIIYDLFDIQFNNKLFFYRILSEAINNLNINIKECFNNIITSYVNEQINICKFNNCNNTDTNNKYYSQIICVISDLVNNKIFLTHFLSKNFHFDCKIENIIKSCFEKSISITNKIQDNNLKINTENLKKYYKYNTPNNIFIKLFLSYLNNQIKQTIRYINSSKNNVKLRNILYNKTSFNFIKDNFLLIFKLISDKDIFEEEYRYYFIERILINTSKIKETELDILLILKNELGSSYIKKLETIIQDSFLSKQLNLEFNLVQNKTENNKLDNNFMILTNYKVFESVTFSFSDKYYKANFYDSYYNNFKFNIYLTKIFSNLNCNEGDNILGEYSNCYCFNKILNKDLKLEYKKFYEYYKKKNACRILKLIPNLSWCEVNYKINNEKKIVLICSLIQYLILNIFNNNKLKKFSIYEIKSLINIIPYNFKSISLYDMLVLENYLIKQLNELINHNILYLELIEKNNLDSNNKINFFNYNKVYICLNYNNYQASDLKIFLSKQNLKNNLNSFHKYIDYLSNIKELEECIITNTKKNQMYSMNYCTIRNKNIYTKSDNSISNNIYISEDSKFKVDCFVIKILKSKKLMDFSDLKMEINNVMKNNFKPSSDLIKSRLESLIERNLVQRDDINNNLFKYCI